jgi:hypothetical protein
MLQVIPGFTVIENYIKKYGIVFTLIVMYQGLFGGLSISHKPKVFTKLSQNFYFKLFNLFCIAFTATRDIEISLISLVLFLIILYFIRLADDREDVSLKKLL